MTFIMYCTCLAFFFEDRYLLPSLSITYYLVERILGPREQDLLERQTAVIDRRGVNGAQIQELRVGT